MDYGDTLSVHNERSGIDKGHIITAGATHLHICVIAFHFDYRYGFTGKQRLIYRKVRTGEKNRVGRHSVAFTQDDDIAAHHFTSGNTPLLSIADHKGTRT